MNLVRESIAAYLPSLIELENDLALDWPRIDQLFSEEIEKREKRLENSESIQVSPTIYDAIIK